MVNRSAAGGDERGRPACGHTKAGVRFEWETLPPNVPGSPLYVPHRCVDCGLLVPVPPTFGGSLLFALCGVFAIVLLAALGILPYILMGIWAMLAIGLLAAVVSPAAWLVKTALVAVAPKSRTGR